MSQNTNAVPQLPPEAQTPEGFAAYRADDNSVPLQQAAIALTVVATFFVFLRFLSRRLTHARLWWDDWLCLLALVLSYSGTVLGLYGPMQGLGHHTLAWAESIPNFSKASWGFSIVWTFNLTIVKLSLLFLYKRIFPVEHPVSGARMHDFYSVFWWVTMTSVICWGLAFFFVVLLSVLPFESIWTFPQPPGTKVINLKVAQACGAGFTILNDVLLIALPIIKIVKLKLDHYQKAALIAIFGLAALVTFATAARLYWNTAVADNVDFLYSAVNAFIWAVVEIWLAVICVCLPVLTPLLRLAGRKIHLSTPDKSFGSSSDGDHLSEKVDPARYSAAAPPAERLNSDASAVLPYGSLSMPVDEEAAVVPPLPEKHAVELGLTDKISEHNEAATSRPGTARSLDKSGLRPSASFSRPNARDAVITPAVTPAMPTHSTAHDPSSDLSPLSSAPVNPAKPPRLFSSKLQDMLDADADAPRKKPAMERLTSDEQLEVDLRAVGGRVGSLDKSEKVEEVLGRSGSTTENMGRYGSPVEGIVGRSGSTASAAGVRELMETRARMDEQVGSKFGE